MTSKVFIISDLHLGHRHIIDFAGHHRGGTDVESHDDWIIDQWNSVVCKRDVVIVLGDVAFTKQGLAKVAQLRGTKHLIMGNHDQFPVPLYQRYFTLKPSLYSYKGFWLTHCPIHPKELRGKMNIHGHVHHHPIEDDRYFNACVEACAGVPFRFDRISHMADIVKGVSCLN